MLLVRAANDAIDKQTFNTVPIIGGIFVVMSLPIAFRLIIQHMLYYSKPKLQKHIIRILWMVPIYSVNAWFSLWYPDNVLLLNSVRECYEAYVIYSFMRFLFNYLHENVDDLEETLRRKPQVHHLFPLCFLEDWTNGRELIHKCKHGILQYTVTRPLMTVIIILCHFSGDKVKENIGFFLTMAVNNVSQFIAMYCLVLFYFSTKEELAPMKPVGKFLCIKAVVFFSFFQSVIINILVWTGILMPVLELSNFQKAVVGDTASYLQNFLLCFEMFLAAIGHHYSFRVDPYAEVIITPKSWKEAFYALWDFSDVGADIKEHLGVLGTSLKKSIQTRNVNQLQKILVNSDKSEASPLLVDNFKHTDSSVIHRDTSNIHNNVR